MSDLPTREDAAKDLASYERHSRNVMGEDWGDVPYLVLKAYVDGVLVPNLNRDQEEDGFWLVEVTDDV